MKKLIFVFISIYFINFNLIAQIPPQISFKKIYQDNLNSYIISASNDQVQNTYIFGHLNGSIDLDPSPEEVIVNSPNPFGYYLAKYNLNGNLLWYNLILCNHEEALINASFNIEAGYPVIYGKTKEPLTYGYFSNGRLVFETIGNASDNFNSIIMRLTGALPYYFIQTYQDQLIDFRLKTRMNSVIMYGQFLVNNNYALKIDYFSIDYLANSGFDTQIIGGNGNVALSGLPVFNGPYSLIYSGYFSGSIDFDPGPNEIILKSDPNQNNYFLTGINSKGELWAKKAPTGELWEDIQLDRYGNIFVRDRASLKKFDPNGNFLWSTITGIFLTYTIGTNNHIFISKSNYDANNKLVASITELDNDGNFLGTKLLPEAKFIDLILFPDLFDPTKMQLLGRFNNTQSVRANAMLLPDQGIFNATFSNLAPLPLNLINFTGKPFDRKNRLFWETSNEVDHHSFEIERSENAQQWEKIGEILAKSKGNEITNYQFEDDAILAKTNFYRLKIISNNGNSQYSKVIFLKNELEGSLSIYPNPVSNDLFLENKFPIISVGIYDLSGQKVSAFDGSQISNSISISNLSEGTYFVKVQDKSSFTTKKIVVKK